MNSKKCSGGKYLMNITEVQVNALQELVNIGVGRAAGMLNRMLDSHIGLDVPCTQVLSLIEAKQVLEARFQTETLAAVKLGFSGSLVGVAEIVFPTESASALVALLTGEALDAPDLDAIKIGTLSEVGNIAINGVIGSISNLFQQSLDYSLPIYTEDTVEQLLTADNLLVNAAVLLAQAHFFIERLQISGDIILLFKLDSFDALLAAIDLDAAKVL